MIQLTDKQFRAKDEALAFVDKGASVFTAQQSANQPSASIVGVGIGQDSVRLYVEGGALPAGAIPDAFNGIQTILIGTPGFTVVPVARIQSTRVRPTPCGVSVGHHNSVTAGTLGCVVQDSQGTRYILSNNHIIADNNKGTIGAPIVQPGPMDGGTAPNDTIAELAMWAPLFFNNQSNYVDAAIAELGSPSLVQPDIQGIGRINPVVVPATVGQAVQKHGRTTGHTTGFISAVGIDISVNYNGNRAWFENQIEIGTAGFSDGGDSGSLIVTDPNNETVGLLFAGDGTRTLANPIDDVLAAFNVSLV